MSKRSLFLTLAGVLSILFAASAVLAAYQPPAKLMQSRSRATGPANGQRVFVDLHGKYAALTVGPLRSGAFLWSNDGGLTWSAPVRLLTMTGFSFQPLPIVGAMSPDGQTLYVVSKIAPGGPIVFDGYPIRRDASNNITGLGPAGLDGWATKEVILETSSNSQRPSLTLQANGLPAVAWAYDTVGTHESGIRFSRASGDPGVEANWTTASGCTTSACGARQIGSHWVDVLAPTPGVDTESQVVLVKAPTSLGKSWSDELVLLYTSKEGRGVRARRATASGAGYSAWSPAAVLYNDLDTANRRNLNLSAAPDPVNGLIWFSYSAYQSPYYRTILARIDLAISDTTWATTKKPLFPFSTVQSDAYDAPSLAYDQMTNRVFVFGILDGDLTYRRWNVGLDSGDPADFVLDGDTNNWPSALGNPTISGGGVPLIWTKLVGTNAFETWYARTGP